MRTLLSTALVALLARTAAASPAPPAEDASYRSVTMTTDALLLASALGGAVHQSTRVDGAPLQPWFTISAASSLLATPIIHAAMGHRERSPGSFGVRIGLALAGGYVAYRLNDDCGDGLSCQMNNVDYGVLAGLVAGSVIDAMWISTPSKEHAEPKRVIAPQFGPTRDGAVVGLGGTF